MLAELPVWLADAVSGLPERTPADKTFQHPRRVLSILALAYLVGHAVPRGAAWLHGRIAAPFVLMGQHGLPVFCATVVLSFVARVAIERSGGGWPTQVGVNAGGLAALVAIAAMAAWLKPPRGAPREADPADRSRARQDGAR